MFDSISCPSFGRNGSEFKVNMSNAAVELTPGTTFQGFQEFYGIVYNETGNSFIASDIEVLIMSGKPQIFNQLWLLHSAWLSWRLSLSF